MPADRRRYEVELHVGSATRQLYLGVAQKYSIDDNNLASAGGG
jgi:hypothetical protein